MEEEITPIVEYKDCEGDELNYVVVKVDIEGLKKNFWQKEPSNATIHFHPKQRSFSLELEVFDTKSSGVLKRYKYEVRQLPADISPCKSFYKVRKGEIEMRLCKKQAMSWSSFLASKGLEHYQPDSQPDNQPDNKLDKQPNKQPDNKQPNSLSDNI